MSCEVPFNVQIAGLQLQLHAGDSLHFAHTVYLWLSQHSTHQMLSLMAVHCVFCEVRTASFCIKWIDDQLQTASRSASRRRTRERSGGGFNSGYIKHRTVSSLFRHIPQCYYVHNVSSISMDSKMSFILNIQVYRDATPFETVNSSGYFEVAQWLHNIAEDLYLRDNLRDRMYFHHLSPGALSRCSLRESIFVLYIPSNIVILFSIQTGKFEKFSFSRTHVACGSFPCVISVFSGDHSTADRGRPYAGRHGLCARTAEFDVSLRLRNCVQLRPCKSVHYKR